MMELHTSEFERRAHAARERSYIDDYPERMDYRDNAFLRFLDSRSDAYLLKRKRRVKAIRTKEEAIAYRDSVREAFKRCVGPLPDCPPGRVEVTGTLHKDGYSVDCVTIEAMPGVFITANFYYPAGVRYPAPAVLFPCGHAAEGKASPMYVSFGVEVAKNGFCTLIYDPIGQGERRLPGEAPGEERLSPVDAHCKIDRQASVLDEHAAAYMLAESRRALDYLLARPEVDPTRVAVSGNSGGGMMSAYMGAYDDRLHAVAPCCYITELRAMLQRILAQDAEQCTPGFMEQGLDLSDLITAAAPRPYMVGAALFDFFPIEGVRDALVEAKGLYRLMGVEERVHVSIAPKGHGMWVETRLAVLRFLCREFDVPYRGNEAVDYESLPSEAELLCAQMSPTGGHELQAYISSRAGAMFRNRPHPAEGMDVPERLIRVLKLSEPHETRLLARESSGTTADGWEVTRLVIESEPGMTIECKLVRRVDTVQPDTLCAVVGPLPEDVVSAATADPNCSLLFVQPRGIGTDAMHPRSSFGMFDVETGAGYYARLLGRTLQGMRVADVLAALRVLQDECGLRPAELRGAEEHALTALYAAVLAKLGRVRLHGLLRAFRDVPVSEHHRWGHGIFAAGLGLHVDVQELLAELPAGGVTVERWLDVLKRDISGTTNLLQIRAT